MTIWYLFFRNFASQVPTFPWTPNFLSLWSKTPWSTLSKAFAKSKYTESTPGAPCSTPSRIESQWDRSCVSVERSALNPCWPADIWLFVSRCFTRSFLITRSNNLIMWEVRATGRKFFGIALLPPLCNGQMAISNKSRGISPGLNCFAKLHWELDRVL
mgnify:CR=1 FL=1